MIIKNENILQKSKKTVRRFLKQSKDEKMDNMLKVMMEMEKEMHELRFDTKEI